MRFLALSSMLVLGAPALGDVPQMGGPMSHMLVTFFDNQVFIGFESPSLSEVELTRAANTFDGGASVLDHTAHNSQFGWLVNGFVSLPQDSGVFVRTIESSSGLMVFEESSFDPILGTHGSSDVWEWDGTMTHNWYSTTQPGEHSAIYEVYVGESDGTPISSWSPGRIELRWVYDQRIPTPLGPIGIDKGRIPWGSGAQGGVPSPSTLGALLGFGLIAPRKRR